MRGVEYNGREELTLLKLVLLLHGAFRRRWEPIRVTPLQSDAFFSLHRHTEARVPHTATSLRVRQPTVVEMVRRVWCISGG